MRNLLKSSIRIDNAPDTIDTTYIIDRLIDSGYIVFCNVDNDCVIQNSTARSLYEVPIMLHKNGLDKVVCKKFHIKDIIYS